MGTGDLNSDPQAFPLKTSPTWPFPAPSFYFRYSPPVLSFLKVVRVSCRQHNFRRHKDVAVGLSGQSPRWVTRLTPEGLELSITEYLTVKVSLSELCLQKVLKSSSHCKVSWRTSTKSHVYETSASLQRLSQTWLQICSKYIVHLDSGNSPVYWNSVSLSQKKIKCTEERTPWLQWPLLLRIWFSP